MILSKAEIIRNLNHSMVLFLCLILFAPCLLVAPANADSLDSYNDIEVKMTQKTRFGDVSLVSSDAMPADKIMFHGKLVFEDRSMYVNLYGYFRLKDYDAILIGSNPGGSSTPETRMSFLVINSQGFPHVISDERFLATSESEIRARKVNGNLVSVRLGCRFGVETIAELKSDKLTLKSMPPNTCENLYSIAQDASEHCNRDGNASQSEINACVNQDYQSADKEINDVYKNLLSQLSLNEQVILRKDQRKWLKELEPYCSDDAAEYTGGSYWAFAYYSCKTIQTEGRIQILQNWKEWHTD